MRTRAVLISLFILIASALWVGALADASFDPLLYILPEDGVIEFSYTPPANSEYALFVFSSSSSLARGSAEIIGSEGTLASGSGSGEICSAWLVAGIPYTIRVSCDAPAIIELARDALSRSSARPLTLNENEVSGKMIARAYDAHWYEFTCEHAGRLMLTLVPEDDDLILDAALFDSSGRLVGEFESLPGGACLLLMQNSVGENYRIRASAPGGGTGYYEIRYSSAQRAQITRALRFKQENYELSSGNSYDFADEIEGEPLLWVSDAPGIVSVNSDGTLIALSPGEVTLYAHAVSSRASCTLHVMHVPTKEIEILGTSITLSVGDAADVQLKFHPSDASDKRVAYSISDEKIASISSDGVLTGLAEGEAVLSVRTQANLTDSIIVHVQKAAPRYRALLVGEENYPFSDNPVRKGSRASVHALEGLLESGRGSFSYIVSTQFDLSRAELTALIRSSFASATEQDVSLFYINCHGFYKGGMSFLELSDGATLSLRDLERDLRKVPGTVVVLLDCCNSGGAIGQAAFNKGASEAFAAPALLGSKYKVLTSAGLDQDSYRIAFNDEMNQGVMVTSFVRAICDGAGWDIDKHARGTMRADSDFNSTISFDELYRYTAQRVNWYMSLASKLTVQNYSQNVQVHPKGDPFVFFERKRR